MNRLQLKALLLDSITHYKNGTHLAPNYRQVKAMFCEMVGVSTKTSSKKMIDLIYAVYVDNNLQAEADQTLRKFNII
jgi:uncharacterized protein YjaG (DUF416 family)